MIAEQLNDAFQAELPYTPNAQQQAVAAALARFCIGLIDGDAEAARPSAHRTFVVNGYAGTGKTSLIAALVRTLRRLKVNVVLMAPTGRAAKVFSAFANMQASTIHRRIYRHSVAGEVPGLKENRDTSTLYIVDEASMIGSDTTGNRDLLSDLLSYAFAGNNNRLILLGDTAQLPPVGDIVSPAMDLDNLRKLGLKVSAATLTKVVRQQARSGILANATSVRRQMGEEPLKMPSPIVEGYPDVHTVTPVDLPEVIDTSYRTCGIDETIIITRSNRRAADFNKAVRAQVLFYEEELVRGEPIMIVKNNYYWTRVAKRRDIDFIANGDIMRISRIIGTEIKHGFRFADVEVTPIDETGAESESAPLQVKIFLETLASDQPALPAERLGQLYKALLHSGDYANAQNPLLALANDPYWNALQTKYAYCVTCHKAQGGQWNHVLVDTAGISPDATGMELLRWMYTACTRARRNLSFITDQY